MRLPRDPRLIDWPEPEPEPKARRVVDPRARWMIRGGVARAMWLASALGLWPYRWTLDRGVARRWEHREHAQTVAGVVDGEVIDREAT